MAPHIDSFSVFVYCTDVEDLPGALAFAPTTIVPSTKTELLLSSIVLEATSCLEYFRLPNELRQLPNLVLKDELVTVGKNCVPANVFRAKVVALRI